MTKTISRFLTIPKAIDASALSAPPKEGETAKAVLVPFSQLLEQALVFVPWGTEEQHRAMEAILAARVASEGDVLEFTNAHHGVLVAAMNELRQRLSAQQFVLFLPFFAAVATAPTVEPQ